METNQEIINELRIALIKLAVLTAMEAVLDFGSLSKEQIGYLEDVYSECNNVVNNSASLTDGTPDGVFKGLKDLLASIDKLPKE